MYNGIEFSYAFFDANGEQYFFKSSDLAQLDIHSIISDSDVEETKERLVVTVKTPINDNGAQKMMDIPYFYRGDAFRMIEKINEMKLQPAIKITGFESD